MSVKTIIIIKGSKSRGGDIKMFCVIIIIITTTIIIIIIITIIIIIIIIIIGKLTSLTPAKIVLFATFRP